MKSPFLKGTKIFLEALENPTYQNYKENFELLMRGTNTHTHTRTILCFQCRPPYQNTSLYVQDYSLKRATFVI